MLQIKVNVWHDRMWRRRGKAKPRPYFWVSFERSVMITFSILVLFSRHKITRQRKFMVSGFSLLVLFNLKTNM